MIDCVRQYVRGGFWFFLICPIQTKLETGKRGKAGSFFADAKGAGGASLCLGAE